MFSRLRQKAPPPPLVGGPENMPVWHNVYFRNSRGHTYYSPPLVRKGISTLSQMLQGGQLRTDVKLPPTWLPVYAAGVKKILDLPVQDLPAEWARPGHKMLGALCPLERPQKRQEPAVWQQFARLHMPGGQRDFMRKALWKKLAVGAQTQTAYHQPKCVFCSQLETVHHILSAFKFWPVATDIVVKAFGPVWGPAGVMCPMNTLLISEPLLNANFRDHSQLLHATEETVNLPKLARRFVEKPSEILMNTKVVVTAYNTFELHTPERLLASPASWCRASIHPLVYGESCGPLQAGQ